MSFWQRHVRFMKRLGPTGPLAVVAAVMPPISGMTLIFFMPSVASWLQGHSTFGIWMYMLGFAVLSGVALLPTYAQAALGGYAFGLWLGLPAAMIGFAGGALIGFLIARRASGDRVMKILQDDPKWVAIRNALVRDHESRGFWKSTGMVALLRMPPNSPFALTNLIMASVKVPLPSFVLGTVLGMLPRTAAAVWVGATVSGLTSGGFETPRWLKIAGLIASIAVLIVIMVIADRAVKSIIRTDAARNPPEPPPPPAPPLPRL